MESDPNCSPIVPAEEIEQLLVFMAVWQTQGRLGVEREIHLLLRDYVRILLYTGMRHGTEAMGIRWRDLEWHTKADVRYLRVWVDGKTGGRWLIAKHAAVAVLSDYTQDRKTSTNSRLKRHSPHGCRISCSVSVMDISHTVWWELSVG